MSIKSDQLWERFGDYAASVPLGRVGLIKLVELTDKHTPRRWDVDLCLKRVQREGGPTTPPPKKKPERWATEKFFASFESGQQPDFPPDDDTEDTEDTEEMSDDGVQFEPLDVERTLYVYDKSQDQYKTYIQQAKGWVTTTGDAHRSVVQW